MIIQILLYLFIVIALVGSLFSLFAATVGLMFVFGAPWVPTPPKVAREMLKLADVKPGDVVTDLGSGDGAILIVAAKEFGVKKAIGYELHPGLVWFSRLRAFLSGVGGKVVIHQKNVYKAQFEKTDVVTTYLLEPMMERLAPLLRQQLKPRTRIVSRGFKFPRRMKPTAKKKAAGSQLYLYRAKDLK